MKVKKLIKKLHIAILLGQSKKEKKLYMRILKKSLKGKNTMAVRQAPEKNLESLKPSQKKFSIPKSRILEKFPSDKVTATLA